MLALQTGWTPDVLAQMPAVFRAACHWAIYAGAIVGPEGFPSTEVPGYGADPKVRIAVMRQAAQVAEHRAILFPEDDDGDA